MFDKSWENDTPHLIHIPIDEVKTYISENFHKESLKQLLGTSIDLSFYGAEVNYFLENKDNYHLLIRTLRPNWRKQQRAQTEKMRQKSKDERADRKKNKANKNKDENQQ